MLTMDKMLDRENDAIMTYCEDLFNEWRTHYSPNKAAQRQRFNRLERVAECQRIDNALQNGVDPYAKTLDLDAELRMRAWAIRIGC